MVEQLKQGVTRWGIKQSKKFAPMMCYPDLDAQVFSMVVLLMLMKPHIFLAPLVVCCGHCHCLLLCHGMLPMHTPCPLLPLVDFYFLFPPATCCSHCYQLLHCACSSMLMLPQLLFLAIAITPALIVPEKACLLQLC